MAEPLFQANGTAQTITTIGVAVGFPTHQINDLAILRVKSPNEAVSLSTLAGFTALGTALGTGTPGAAGAARLTIYYRFCTTSSETSPVVAALASTRQQFAWISTYRGVYIGNPPIIGSRGVGTGTSVTMTGATTTTADTRVVMTIADGIDANGARASAQANADLTSIVENFDNGSNTDIGGGLSSASGVKVAAGAYGNSTATLTTSTGYEWATIILSSLAEAPATDTTPPEIVDIGPTPIGPNTPATWRVTDETGLRAVAVIASFPNSGIDGELVYDSVRFRGLYRNSSATQSGSATDQTFTALRSGGWPEAPVFEWLVVDTSGNVGVLG